MNALGSSVLERIGKTPLVRLERLGAHLKGVQILAKVEGANPGGSAKDRSAAAIVADAKQRGLLRDNKRLLDASSGNAAVSYAMLGAALGFPVTICMPEDVSPAQKRIVAAYGAEAVYTPGSLGLDGAIFKARELVGDDPARYCYVDQFSNDVNWQAHYRSTGAEIWQQTEGSVTHFVAGVGSSGTFLGTTRKLKEHCSGLEAIALQPDASVHELAGLKHIATTMLPAIYSPYLADRNITVGMEEASATRKRLALEEGLLVGISGAAAVAACLRIGEELSGESAANGKEAVIVTILCDGGDRYQL
jgi:S-sulfo-L-cysteine synthase (O-acetyl-L-serine-dependent)